MIKLYNQTKLCTKQVSFFLNLQCAFQVTCRLQKPLSFTREPKTCQRWPYSFNSCHHIYGRLEFWSYSPGETIPACDTFGNCKIHYHGLTQDFWMKLGRRNWSKAVHCCAMLQTFWRLRVFTLCKLMITSDYALSPRNYNVSQLNIIAVDYILLCRVWRSTNLSENSSRTGISSPP